MIDLPHLNVLRDGISIAGISAVLEQTLNVSNLGMYIRNVSLNEPTSSNTTHKVLIDNGSMIQSKMSENHRKYLPSIVVILHSDIASSDISDKAISSNKLCDIIMRSIYNDLILLLNSIDFLNSCK